LAIEGLLAARASCCAATAAEVAVLAPPARSRRLWWATADRVRPIRLRAMRKEHTGLRMPSQNLSGARAGKASSTSNGPTPSRRVSVLERRRPLMPRLSPHGRANSRPAMAPNTANIVVSDNSSGLRNTRSWAPAHASAGRTNQRAGRPL